MFGGLLGGDFSPAQAVPSPGSRKRARPRLLDSLPVAMSGILASTRQPWSKSRYTYELRGARLLVLRPEPKGVREVDVLAATEVELKPDGRTLRIEVAPRALVLRADTAAEAQAWLAALVRARQRVSRKDFAVRGLLGAGHFGEVYLSSPVGGVGGGGAEGLLAAKRVEVSKASDVLRLQRERVALEAACGHPFLLSLQFAFRERNCGWLVTDFKAGGDLRELLISRRDQDPLPLVSTRVIMAELLLAVEHLHAHKIAHRDIKPDNILLDLDGHVCLADLGLARPFQSSFERSSSFCGTYGYIAPELLQPHPSHGMAADFFSLGCVLYELLSGRPAFASQRRDRTNHAYLPLPDSAGEAAAALVAALLKPNPLDRLASADAARAHPFFAGLDWAALARKELRPLTGVMEVAGVDPHARVRGVAGAGGAADGWAADLEGFDFVRPAASSASSAVPLVPLVRAVRKGGFSVESTAVASSS